MRELTLLLVPVIYVPTGMITAAIAREFFDQPFADAAAIGTLWFITLPTILAYCLGRVLWRLIDTPIKKLAQHTRNRR
jgi:hypothetical protein